MDDLISSIPVIIMTILAVITIFWFTNRAKKQKELKIRQFAESFNWTYEPILESFTWGYRMKSPEWILESFSQSKGPTPDSGSSNISQDTLWKTFSVSLPENSVIIGPRPAPNISGEMGTFLAQTALRAFLGDQAENLKEVLLDNSLLNRCYLIFAHDPADADQLLMPASQELLVEWKNTPPVIKLSPHGLVIELKGIQLEDPAEILKFIQLGESFLKWEAK
jgi:hypothetical protein